MGVEEIFDPLTDAINTYGGFSAFDTHTDSLRQSVGLLPYQFRIVICLLAALPLASVFHFINAPRVRVLWGLVWGVYFDYFVFRWQCLHVIIPLTLAYVFMRYPKLCPLGATKGHVLVFGMMMGHLTLLHLWRTWYAYMNPDADLTAPQMMLVVKITSLACNLADGREMKAGKKLSHEQEREAEPQCPSVVEFFGFGFFFPNFLAASNLTYRQYHTFIYNPTGRPSCLVPFGKKMLQCFVLYFGVQLTSVFPLRYLTDDAFVAQTSYAYRCVYVWLALLGVRCQYYFAWLVTEAACIGCGAAYNGRISKEEGKAILDSYGEKWGTFKRIITTEILSTPVDSEGHRWDGARMVDLKFEVAMNYKEITDSWNIPTGFWLRVHVFKRVTKNVILTQLFSAFWHGLYPGYYLFFGVTSFATICARLSRTKIRPKVPPALKQVYDVVSWAVTCWSINTLALAFVLLDFLLGLKAWSAFYYTPVIFTFVYLGILQFIPGPKTERQRQEGKKVEKAITG